VEFMCGYCGGKSLWLVAVNQEHVTVKCLTCGKQSTIDRAAKPPPANLPPRSYDR
jgi:DNA-directed RNA polymerase subunit RPC12/RpoP